MCDILFLVPDLVAFSCYTVNIHLEKWLMRYDTKRAIWWNLCNKYIFIFCIKHMSTIFRTLQVNEWWSKKQMFFSYCETNATKFGTKIKFHLILFGLYHAVEIDHTILLLEFVAEKVLLLLVISLTTNWAPGFIFERNFDQSHFYSRKSIGSVVCNWLDRYGYIYICVCVYVYVCVHVCVVGPLWRYRSIFPRAGAGEKFAGNL